MLLLKIFFSFVKIGICSVGGGMAAMPILQNELVNVNHWLSMAEFTDLVTIAEITPGPIAVNSATFVGLKMYGFLGAISATAGVILAPCIIVFSLAYAYSKFSKLSFVQGILNGIRPAIVSLIATAGLTILVMAIWGDKGFSLDVNSINFIALILFAGALFVIRKFKFNPIYVMLGCGVIGGVIYNLPILS